jgi:hypothetical protein
MFFTIMSSTYELQNIQIYELCDKNRKTQVTFLNGSSNITQKEETRLTTGMFLMVREHTDYM